MSALLDDYRQQLLLSLRLHGIPGPRIAETLAEVDSHVAETGDDPREAFGAAQAYARQVSQSLGHHGHGGWLGLTGSLVRSLTPLDWGRALAAFAGGFLLAGGLIGIGAGWPFHGLPAAVSTVVGLALLGALAGWQVLHDRQHSDRVLDPRTGTDMAPPFPRWALVLLVALPGGLVLLGYLLTAS